MSRAWTNVAGQVLRRERGIRCAGDPLPCERYWVVGKCPGCGKPKLVPSRRGLLGRIVDAVTRRGCA